MAALTKSNPRIAASQGCPYVIFHPLSCVTDTFFAGGASYVDPANGGITPIPAAGLTFNGWTMEETVAVEDVTRVKTARNGWWEIPITAVATDIGKFVFSEVAEASDNPADFAIFATGAAAAAGDICIGKIVDVVNGRPIVDIEDRVADLVGS